MCTIVCLEEKPHSMLDIYFQSVIGMIFGGSVLLSFLVPLGNPRRFDHDDHSHGGSTPFIIFKVTLALLVPVFLLLVGAFLWRLRKLKAQVGEWRSNEDSKSIGLTGTQKGQRKSQLEVGCTYVVHRHLCQLILFFGTNDRVFRFIRLRNDYRV